MGRGVSRRAKLTSRAVAETLFTTREGPPPADRLDWLVDDLDDFLARAGSRARLIYRLCILAIAIVAPLLVWRLPPFRALSASRRTVALERLERSPLGLALLGAKAVLCILYFEHPDAAKLVGYDGACVEEDAGAAA